MKIAICLSGLSRCALLTFESLISNIAIPLNADIFIHTWDIDDDKNRIGSSVDSTKCLGSNKTEFFAQYEQVKGVKIEQFSGDWNFLNIRRVANVVPMYYSIFAANQLKIAYEQQQRKAYDVVIRSRFDSLYQDTLITHELVEATNNNSTVFIGLNAINKGPYASRRNFKSEDTSEPFVADNFAFGSSAAMNSYSNTYCNLGNILNYTSSPETCLGMQLMHNKLTPVWTKYKYKSLIEWGSTQSIFWSDYEKPETLYIS
jgi:hypothetical protein